MTADIFETTERWFVAAGQQPAEPTYDPKQVCFYLGMQVEELTEKLALIAGPEAVQDLVTLADKLKAAPPELCDAIDVQLRRNPKIAAEWLDADCDLLWVTIGAMRALGAKSGIAYRAVAMCNWDKFTPAGPLRDVNGKVLKRPGWCPPELTPYLPTELREEVL